MEAQPLRLLSLDGGGTWGLSSLIILQQFMKRIDPTERTKPCEYFHLMGGSGTGGIIALMLGRLEMDIRTCISAYIDLTSRVFRSRDVLQRDVRKGKFKKDLISKSVDFLLMKGIYRSDALEDAVKNMLGDDRRALVRKPELQCKVFVCASTRSTRTHIPFRSYTTQNAVEYTKTCKIWEAAGATSANSTLFDPITIEGIEYIDGGLGRNNPVNQVIEEANSIWSDMLSKNRIECLVSIGTGVSIVEEAGTHPRRLIRTLRKIGTDTDTTARDFENFSRNFGISDRYFRFDVGRGPAQRAGPFRSYGPHEYEHPDVVRRVTLDYLDFVRMGEVNGLVPTSAPAPVRAAATAHRDALHLQTEGIDTLIECDMRSDAEDDDAITPLPRYSTCCSPKTPVSMTKMKMGRRH